MWQYFNQKRGQSFLEYTLMIVIILAALLTMQMLMKREVQNRLRTTAEDIGSGQYSDGNTNYVKTVIRNSDTVEADNAGNQTTTMNLAGYLPHGEITNTTENSVILNTQQEFWGST
jgi:uncharacterized protein (UPF0333 family)